MLEFFEVLFISIVQGIGEFLPISSSGHLVVVEHLFDRFGIPLTEHESDFIKLAVFLHVGTLVAVLIVFWRRILDLFGKDARLIPLLIVGTLPAVAVGLSVRKFAPWIVQDLSLTAGCFFVTGVLLLISMKRIDGERLCGEMTWYDALFIGTVQAIAIMPGISRSGSTIVAGLFRKLRRDEAATFSFLLSIPVIAGGGILELKDVLRQTPSEQGISNGILAVGMLVSCIVGIVALIWLLDWLKKGKLWYFAAWLFLMSPITFLLAATVPSPEPGVVHEFNFPYVVTKLSKDEPLTDFREIKIVNVPDSQTDAIENVEPSGRQNMSREEAQREYERILAEEEAKELALIEEERTRKPLVDEPEKLLPLDPNDRIWITPDGKSVVTLARVTLREGLLELFGCRIGTKEHESVVSVRVKPFLIHAALLAVGAEPGKPVQMTPTFVPPSGDEIEIRIRWRDEDGETKEALAQDWVWDAVDSREDAKKAMSTHWVFTGSMTYKDDAGENHYVADESGELFGLSNFVGAILDIPIESSADNEKLMFGCFTERIPELDTPLTLILTPVKNKKR